MPTAPYALAVNDLQILSLFRAILPYLSRSAPLYFIQQIFYSFHKLIEYEEQTVCEHENYYEL